jgi:hypothetical protein
MFVSARNTISRQLDVTPLGLEQRLDGVKLVLRVGEFAARLPRLSESARDLMI